MERSKAFLLFVSLILILGACTKYESPTGEVVSEKDLKEGQILDVTIESVTDQGLGMAKVDGITLLVPDTEVGETVLVKIMKITGGVGYAEFVGEVPILEEPEEKPAVEIEEQSEEIESTEEETITGLPVQDYEADIVAYEGDLIDLKPAAFDPDGDEVFLGFTAPFDNEGKWQTKEGDAGLYSVIVTATDSKSSLVTKQMVVRVLVRNKPPVITIPNVLEFYEGDLIVLNPKITDDDGDEVVVTYSGWMSKTYQTTFGDAGTYKVTITADDGKTRVYKDVTIIVHKMNRKPELNILSGFMNVVTAGEMVEIISEASDPDGDSVIVRFSEPFGQDGKWQTQPGDEGTYVVKVNASDGADSVIQEVLVEVMKRNNPPVIESLWVEPQEVILKKPGDKVTIRLFARVSDSDGDNVILTYSGFMDSAERTVEYGESGGIKTVTVTANDGKDSVSKDITFSMNNWPCFNCQ